ncbi:MAG: hypothetical protein KDB86_01470, partial [Actinobacteria bacterium]|nr:hypothetical protein [Actinomycetota bacterium]
LLIGAFVGIARSHRDQGYPARNETRRGWAPPDLVAVHSTRLRVSRTSLKTMENPLWSRITDKYETNTRRWRSGLRITELLRTLSAWLANAETS